MFQTSCFLTILFTFQRKMSKEILSRSIGYRLKTAILSVSLIAVGLPSALAFPDNKVVATIPTSTGLPLGMAVSPNGKFVYVACRDGGAVDVINAATNKVIASIATGNGTSYAAITPDGQTLFATNVNESTVSVIFTAKRKVVATLPVGTSPNQLAVSPDGKKVYVAIEGDPYNHTVPGGFSIIEVASLAVTTIAIDKSYEYADVVFSADGTKAYLMAQQGGVVTGQGIIWEKNTATDQLVTSFGTTSLYEASGLSISRDANTLYAATLPSGQVPQLVALNAFTGDLLADIALDTNAGYNAGDTVVTPNGKYLYVTDSQGGDVKMVNTSTNKIAGKPIPAGTGPY